MDSGLLKNVNMFSELSDDELKKIYSLSSLKTFGKGEMIFFDTEPYSGFYIVLEGCVKIFKILKDGREHILHFVYPFNTFAEVPLFEQYDKVIKDEFTYPANSMSIERNTRLILIRPAVFYSLLDKNKSMSFKIISGLAKKLRHLNKHIENLSADIPKRLACYLLELKTMENGKFKDGTVELPISKHDLAAYLGTIDETLSRTLKKLQDREIIEVKGKIIFIKNLPALKKISTE
ncbi:MAG: CRP-like cAMP-activated global transcriptional regulator [Ignavibacteria bacterium]|nr:CRP-like cAMP-activated global transcriptional regulator [Ignavibacteria bacterium]